MGRVMKCCSIMCSSARRTFRLRELALFDARLESLVEHGVELCLGSELDLVVGLDVLLNRLATVEGYASQRSLPIPSATDSDNPTSTRPIWAVSLPATISLFEL
jgi:hypothetical protein